MSAQKDKADDQDPDYESADPSDGRQQRELQENGVILFTKKNTTFVESHFLAFFWGNFSRFWDTFFIFIFLLFYFTSINYQ